ncbi:unnamed protein product, partial [Effrenium voratum]
SRPDRFGPIGQREVWAPEASPTRPPAGPLLGWPEAGGVIWSLRGVLGGEVGARFSGHGIDPMDAGRVAGLLLRARGSSGAAAGGWELCLAGGLHDALGPLHHDAGHGCEPWREGR